MKQKIIYVLAFICCLSYLSSAKQSICCVKKCNEVKEAAKPAPVKAKKVTANSSARPFNFYLINL